MNTAKTGLAYAAAVEDLLAWLTVEKGRSRNTVAAYRTDLDRMGARLLDQDLDPRAATHGPPARSSSCPRLTALPRTVPGSSARWPECRRLDTTNATWPSTATCFVARRFRAHSGSPSAGWPEGLPPPSS